MRIVGGLYRGRSITAPPGRNTRPTTDRVREAVFSALSARLGSDLGGAVVLDPFAGSGALGLEALSRGATSVTFVERDRTALATLRRNIAALGVETATSVIPGDVFALAAGLRGGPFSLILLDPPYTLDPVVVSSLLERLATVGVVAHDATVVWERSAGGEVVWPEGFAPDLHKEYGSTAVDFGNFEGDG